MSGVPKVSGSRMVSAGLWESVAHLQRLAALFAIRSGSGRNNGGQNGNDPLRPADGLCWNGTPPASYA